MSKPAIEAARQGQSGDLLRFVEGDLSDPASLAEAGGAFDVILLVNVVTQIEDVQATFEALHAVSHSRTRVLIYSHSRLWQPLFRLAELLDLRDRQPSESWLPPEEVEHMLALADFEVVYRDTQLVCPIRIPVLAELLNCYVGRIPPLHLLSLMFGLVVRPGCSAWWRGQHRPAIRAAP